MDYRAIEANEAILRQSVADATAEGSDDALDVAAAATLQLALLRPWIGWITANSHNGNRTITAVTMVLGAMLAETARNATMRDESGHDASEDDAVMHLLMRIGETAMELAQGHGVLRETGVPVDLRKQADA